VEKKMKHKKQNFKGCKTLLSIALAIAAISSPAFAKKPGDTVISLIQLSDTHGTLVPHGCVIAEPGGTERYSNDCGGVAKLKTLVNDIRDDNPNNLLIAIGDTTHGSAEVMFTVGDAIMPAMNAFGIDAFIPGNWEFGYGPAVFRARFAGDPKCKLPANIRVMADSFDGDCITQATFPTLASNLYNGSGPNTGTAILPAYKVFDVDGVKIAVIGITAAIVPQQATVFNIGLRFSQGIEELPGNIADAKAEGATVIVVASELGLSQNIQIGRDFEEVDVVLSGHTHEVTLGAILASADETVSTTPGALLSGHEQSMLSQGAAIVVEASEDAFLGRLDITVNGSGKIVDFAWDAIPADESVDQELAMQALVDTVEADFTGTTKKRHTFMPGGYCKPFGLPPSSAPNYLGALAFKCGDITKRGLQLTDDLNTIVGTTDVLLHRHDVLEDVWNNFIADAVRDVTNGIGGRSVDISMTNGFRFGTDILSTDEGSVSGNILLRDLYSHFPIGPAVAVAEFSGVSIEKDLEGVLGAVFDRNAYLQRGGWYLGLSNMTQKIDLDNRPFSTSGGRIVQTKIGGVPLDTSKRYTFASCFPHGDAVDRVCRTNGGSNHQFYQLANPDDYNSALSLVAPENDEGLISIQINPANGQPGAVIKQTAPDAFLHPVHALRRYLDSIGGNVNGVDYAIGRIQTVDSTQPGNPPSAGPVSAVDSSLIQPVQGAGPILLPKSAPLQ
jgi:2',3'-cyclic-nucleotide 2'-phosphodiesterase (5'-nucleotidase family)